MTGTLTLAFTFIPVFYGFVDALEGNCRLFKNNKVIRFDLHKEICCDGTVYVKDLDDNGNLKTKCCYGRNSTMYDVETQECCGRQVISKRSFLKGCCQGKVYNKDRYTCCDGEIKSKIATPCCGNEPVNPYDGVQCCGGDMYDRRKQTCCNGFIWDGIGECCGDILVENLANDVCCYHNGASRLHMEAQGTLCCGLDTYRPTEQLCCKSIVRNKFSDTTECCGNTTIDLSREICCQGNVLPRDQTEFGSNSCCGGKLYNEDAEVCCKGKIHPKRGRSKCCGDKAYEEEKFYCFNDLVLGDRGIPRITGVVHFVENGSTAYLRANQFECGGKLMNRTAEDNACCDTTPYNTANHLCCKVYNSSSELVAKKPTHDGCCGGTSYDSEKKGCCNLAEVFDLENEICNKDGVHPRYGNIENAPPSLQKTLFKDKVCKVRGADEVPYNSNMSVCTPVGVLALPMGLDICGNKTFNKDIFICCRGNIFDKYVDDEIQHCCPNPIGKETFIPALQTCCNGEVINIPEKYSSICRGKVYDNRTHGCEVVGEIRSYEEIEMKPSVCWHNETDYSYFNEADERCCNGHIINAFFTCCAEESECCSPDDIQGYNRETHVCCGGVLKSKQPKTKFNRSTRSKTAHLQNAASSCRGSNCLDSQRTQSMSSRSLCCQEFPYDNDEGDLTCDGDKWTGKLRNNSLLCRENVCNYGTDCCGDRSYDEETEICCGGEVLTISANTTCCGNHIFDSSKEDSLCCESSFYENTTGLSCCGGATFNPATETCCTTGSKTYVFPSKDGLCCSNGEDYDDTLHTCCDGLVHKYITSGTCCGNDVIRDPMREGCFNGMVYQL